MLVRTWMTTEVAAIAPTTAIGDAAVEMARRRVRRLPVVDPGAQSHVVGIVSLLDLARAFPPDVNPLSVVAGSDGPRQPVSSIMSPHPKTIAPDAPLEEAAQILLEHRIGALPVVRDSHLVGIITESDIFRALIETSGTSSRPWQDPAATRGS
jgi:acetoin utilization protein AcuB